jgi:hypothetical protein
MGVWGKVEEAVFLGKIVRDYGVVAEDGPQGLRVSAILAGKDNPTLFLRCTYSRILSKSVRYVPLEYGAVQRLGEVIQDAKGRM